MRAQEVLDTMHEIHDARKAVSTEYNEYMKTCVGQPTMTVQNMKSWERSVRAERAMLRMLALMPRQAAELTLPETPHAARAAELVAKLQEAAMPGTDANAHIRQVMQDAAKELEILSHQVLYKVEAARKKR